MAHDEALGVVNAMQRQAAMLARAVVTALKDGKVSWIEGASLALHGTQLANSLISLIQHTDPALREELLYVLEHGAWALPADLP